MFGLFKKQNTIKVCPKCSALDLAQVEAAAKSKGYRFQKGCIGQCCAKDKPKSHIAKINGGVKVANSTEGFLELLS